MGPPRAQRFGLPAVSVVLLAGSMGCTQSGPGGGTGGTGGGAVASISVDGRSVSATAPAGTTLTLASADPQTLPPFPDDVAPSYGALTVDVTGVTPGGSAIVDLVLQSPVSVVRKLIAGS